jgi:methionyl-tRNA formyltransferase
MNDIKIIFMGTPVFSVPVLEGLIANYNVIGVVTQPDKMVGREQQIKFSPIKEVALKNNIKVFQPINIKTDYQSILDLEPDIIITCAYGQIIPKVILDYPKYKCINVHASLLPKLRGGAPIHRAIMDGNFKTGITIMYMAEKMDAGAIISQEEIVIDETDTAGSLHDKLSPLGRKLLLATIPKIISGDIKPIKQHEVDVTYAWNIKREEEKIDFEQTKREVYNQIRGLNPVPGAYTILDKKIIKIYNSRISDNSYPTSVVGEIVNIYEDGIGVKVSDGEIIFTEIQVEGKQRMTAKVFLNGLQDKTKLMGRIYF